MRKRSNVKVSKEDSDAKFEKEAKKQAAMEGEQLLFVSIHLNYFYSYGKQRKENW